MDDLDVIIPVAGMGKRMKSFGPKSLISIDDEKVISRQIRIVRELYPESKIIVVVGFESGKIRKVIPKNVDVLINRNYETTNVAKSIDIGLSHCRENVPCLIVYGDLVFSKEAISSISLENSSILVQKECGQRKQEVGVNVYDGMVTRMSYSLPNKWAHIFLLKNKEKELFRKLIKDPSKSRFLSYEIINEIIDNGGTFVATTPEDLKLFELDYSRDIKRAIIGINK